MKKSYLAFLFIVCSHSLYSQSFTSPNNSWHYNLCNCFSFPYPNTSVPVGTGATTVLNGRSCIEIWTFSPGTASAYVYESNDSVYYYVNALNGFSLLYDFNATVGDTLKIYGELTTSFLDSTYMRIDSIDTVLMNGILKKRFYWNSIQIVSGNTSYLDLGSGIPYIEDIGSLQYLFPQNAVVDPQIGGLRCFQDSNLFYQAVWAPSCDSVFYLGVDNLESKNRIQIQPNPFEDKIAISGNFSQMSKIKILNALGETVYFSNLNNREIDFSFLEKGIYFFWIEDGGSSVFRKIIKI